MKIPKELLYKYSEDRCTEDERKKVEEWLNNGEWDTFDQKPLPVEIKKSIWKKITNQINLPSKLVMITRNYQWLKVAAVLAIVVGSAYLFYFLNTSNRYSERHLFVYSTKTNEQKKVLLSDSSVVFLSPNSTIRVTQPFPDDMRNIELDGEAFFEVAKDRSRPFTVITKNIRTTALGTSFKVTSFTNVKDISVALSYGEVLVQNFRSNDKKDSFYLAPGEMIKFDKTNQYIEKTCTCGKQFNYKENILYFKDAGVREVVNKLEEFYNIKVDYSALENVVWNVTGEFDYQPLKVVMETIAFSCNISYQLNNDLLILEPNISNP